MSESVGKTFQFQFTLPRGERPGQDEQGADYGGVSIHAPARGATASLPTPRGGDHRFNSRSREGSDLRRSLLAKLDASFNSRSREGSDLAQAI